MIDNIYNSLRENNQKIIDYRNSGENWILSLTLLIKNIIVDIGQKEYNYYVATNSIKNADQGEWLFDISFQEIQLNAELTKTLSVPLVVESELSKVSFGGFKEDFDKLFVATSSCRLFIFRATNINELNKFLEYAQSSINSFKNFNIDEGIHIIYWDEIGIQNFVHKYLAKKHS